MGRGRWDRKAGRTSSKVLFVYLEISAGLLCRRPPPPYRFRGLISDLFSFEQSLKFHSMYCLRNTSHLLLFPGCSLKTPSSLSSGNNATPPPPPAPFPFKAPHNLKSIITWKLCRSQFMFSFHSFGGNLTC